MPGCGASAWTSRPPRPRFGDYYDAALQAVLRRDRLDAAIAELAQRSDLAPLVGRLSCLRGVSTLTAVGPGGRGRRLAPAQRRHDRRLPGPYPERVPIGRAPRARPDHQDRQLPRPTAAGRGRLAPPAPATAKRRARAPTRGPAGPRCAPAPRRPGVRLHRRWANLESRRGLRSTLVAVAVARELAGWCWSLAVMDD